MTDLDSPEYQTYLKDQVGDNLSESFDSKYLAILEKLIPDFNFSSTKIIDVGTRKFDSWEYFIEKYSNEITGIDVGAEGIEHCRKHNKKGFIELDAHRLREKFDAATFDLVIAFHSFEHMYDLPLVLRQCHEILKPGGFIFFALPIPSYNWMKGHWYDVPSEEAMIDLCKAAGFKRIVYSERYTDLRIRPEPEMVALLEA